MHFFAYVFFKKPLLCKKAQLLRLILSKKLGVFTTQNISNFLRLFLQKKLEFLIPVFKNIFIKNIFIYLNSYFIFICFINNENVIGNFFVVITIVTIIYC